MTPRPRPPWWTLALLLVVSAELTLQITAFGYRWWTARGRVSQVTDSELTILCLGDSHTWGVGTDNQHSYPRRLEHLLADRWPQRRIRVVNGGVPGNNIWQVFHQLPRHVVDVQPDVILLQVGIDDYWLVDVDQATLKSLETPWATRLRIRVDHWLSHIQLYRLVKLRMPHRERQRTIDANAAMRDVPPPGADGLQEMTTAAAVEPYRSERPQSDIEEDILNFPNDPNPRIALANQLATRHEYERVEALTSELLLMDPDSAKAYIILGEMRIQQGNAKEAAAMFHRATESAPSNPKYWHNLGSALAQTGQIEQAREAWGQFFRLTHDVGILMHLGETYRDSREGQRAMRALLEEVKATSPQEDWALHERLVGGDLHELVQRLREFYLERITAYADARNIPIGLMTYPTAYEDPGLYSLLRETARTHPKAFLIDGHRALSRRFLDPAEELMNGDGSHPNAQGYGLLARYVMERLVDSGLLE